jgi:hypothetical protein
MWNASATAPGIRSTSSTSSLCLVTGMVMPVVSHSWKASEPIAQLGTWPVIATRGTESI